MRRVIRDETGEMISPAEWKSIRKSAAVVFATHLEVLPISRLLAPGRPCKKNFYKRHFAKEWNRAIKALESVAPLLSLCSGTWKADLTLGSVLPGDRPSDASLAAANSRASTPSSVAPSSRILPSNLSRSSHLAPPSSVVSSHAASPSHSSSLVSRAPPLSPRRVSFKSSRPPLPTQSPVPSGPVQRQPASKAVGPKPKRARNQSPASRSKRSRANSAVSGTFFIFIFLDEVDYFVDRRRPPSPRPAFLSLVKGGSQSVSHIFLVYSTFSDYRPRRCLLAATQEPPPSQPRPSPSPSPEPAPKATRSKGKASRVKAASTRSTQGDRRTTTDDDDAAAQPPLAPLSGEDAAGKDASGEEAASGSTEVRSSSTHQNLTNFFFIRVRAMTKTRSISDSSSATSWSPGPRSTTSSYRSGRRRRVRRISFPNHLPTNCRILQISSRRSRKHQRRNSPRRRTLRASCTR